VSLVVVCGLVLVGVTLCHECEACDPVVMLISAALAVVAVVVVIAVMMLLLLWQARCGFSIMVVMAVDVAAANSS